MDAPLWRGFSRSGETVMISSGFADTVLIASLIVSLAAYVWISKRDGSYINVLTPTFVIGVPA